MPRGSSMTALFRMQAVLAELQEGDALDDVLRALDDARTEASMTKAELARRIGVRPAAMRRLFGRGRANPTLKTLVRIAAVLGLRIEVVRVDAGKTRRRAARKRRT